MIERGLCFDHQGLLVFPTLFHGLTEHEGTLPPSAPIYYDFSGPLAADFVTQLREEFKLDASRIILAPRNHDVVQSDNYFTFAKKDVALGSLEYDRNWLEQAVGGTRVGLVEAIMEGSSLVKEAKEKAAELGRAEGLAKGQVRGRAEEARRLLRTALATKFPGLETLPEIESASRVEALENVLIGHVLSATDRAGVEQAIRCLNDPR